MSLLENKNQNNIDNNNILVDTDIIGPFRHEVNTKNLRILLNRINQVQAYDKVGDIFYKVQELYNKNAVIPADLVVQFLKELASRKSTSESIGFRLDLSNSCDADDLEELSTNMNETYGSSYYYGCDS